MNLRSAPSADTPSRSGDDTPTQQVSPDEDVVPVRQVSPDDALKASLLGGAGGKIGRFHILRLLGEGGMGMVFAGYDEELGRKVAIKLLRKLASEDSIGRARLLREAQTLARLSHPNVVTVYEVGEYGRQVYIAMEFVLGDTLQSWLQSARRSWREVVRVFAEAGRGLAVAHAAGILHRDFKPANVLLGEDGRVRVLDFGLALAQDLPGGLADAVATHVRLPGPEVSAHHSHSRRTEELTEAGSIMGTPAYMAPERFTFDRTIDPRSDQFAFCIALFEGLYGKRPFPGRSFEEVRDAILRGTVVDPPGPHNVPGWLRKVVLRGLSRNAADRFPDMPALLTAMQRDPQRARNRVFAGLAAAGVLLAGGYALAQATTDGARACTDARARLHPIWDDRRAEVERGLLATRAVYAADTWARVAPRLDQYADTWAAGHHNACTAHASGEQSAVLLDLRMACLERRRGELAALVDRLAAADSDTVRAAAAAVDGLIPPEQCADTRALAAAVPLPEDPAAAARVVALREELTRARAAVSTAKLAEAATIVAPVVDAASALGFPPLLAEALAVRGSVEVGRGEYEPARKSLEEALWLADTVRDDALLADAMAGLVNLLGARLSRFDEALRWRRHADAVIVRLGETTAGHTALLRAFGVTAGTQGRPAEARELLQRALAIDEALAGPHEGKVIKDLIALGTSEFQAGNAALARSYQERALALGEQLYGPSHPEIARILANLATAAAGLGDLDAAAPLFERALTIIEATYGPDHINAAGTLTNLGTIHGMRERNDLAQPMFERALAILERTLGPEHPDVAAPVHNIGILADKRGDRAGARKYHQRALAIREHNFPENSPEIAESLLQLGDLSYREGDLPAALRDLERAIAAYVANSEHTHQASLPDARFTLARVLRDAGKAARASEEARQAVTEYRALDATRHAEAIAAIEAWLAESPAQPETTSARKKKKKKTRKQKK